MEEWSQGGKKKARVLKRSWGPNGHLLTYYKKRIPVLRAGKTPLEFLALRAGKGTLKNPRHFAPEKHPKNSPALRAGNSALKLFFPNANLAKKKVN